MIALPWKPLFRSAPDADDLVASVTRLRLTRWRDVPRLLWIAFRLRRRFHRAGGGIAVGLAAQPLKRTFWTLTLWHDEAELVAYARSREHAAAMRAFRGSLVETTSARWRAPGRPTWADAQQQLAGAASASTRASSA